MRHKVVPMLGQARFVRSAGIVLRPAILGATVG